MRSLPAASVTQHPDGAGTLRTPSLGPVGSGAMAGLTIGRVNYPGLLQATRDRHAEDSAVLASCDPRTRGALTVQLTTFWSTLTLPLPELERLLEQPSKRLVLSGEPGRSAIYVTTDQAQALVEWLRQLDRERTHPPRNRIRSR
jgi:hypothetical protein